MDPLTIMALLASLAKLGGAVAGAFATVQSGQPLSDDQKSAILAAQRLAGFENDRAINDALNRAAEVTFPTTHPPVPPSAQANPTRRPDDELP